MVDFKKIKNLQKGDKVIWMIYIILCVVSIVEVYSSATSLTVKANNLWQPILGHLFTMVLGFAILWIVHLVPCRWFKVLPIIMIPFSAICLMLLPFIGVKLNDGSRWLSIFGFQFQPSEVAKAAVIITVAMILANMQEEKSANPKAFKYIMGITCFMCLLIGPENLSTAGILFGVVVLMMFIGRIPKRQLGPLLLGILIVGALGLTFIMTAPEKQTEAQAEVVAQDGSELQVEKKEKQEEGFIDRLMHRRRTWKGRIEDFFANTSDPSYDSSLRGKNAQVVCAKTAISTSSFFGKLPGNSVMTELLPQPFSDFIYAIIVEELGFVGGFGVVFLYIVLLIRAGRIANRSQRNFPAFLIMGISLMMVSQAIINMLVVVGLFPVTGQPLPLVSRGGTSIAVNCFYFGMMLSISRYVRKKQNVQLAAQPIESVLMEAKENENDENMN